MAPQTIESYAKQYLSLARTRGLTPNQPITFLFRPNANDQTDVYRVIVSLTEPSFSDTPYNVLWINANVGDPQYLQVLLRTSHVSDSTHRGSWMVITDTANLYKSRQIFRFVVENASDLGIETGDLQLPIANTTRLGTVILKDEPADPEEVIVVSSSDPRMSDPRYPLPHDHDDYPRTMIRLNGEQYVEVGSSVAPQPGYVLAIVDISPTDKNKFIGRWVKPTANNVDWNSPHLLSLRISLPGNASFMSDNTDVKMVAVAEFEDRVVQDPAGVVWSIQANAVGVTISEDGTVHAPDLNADVILLVTAKLKDPVYGNWVTTTYDLHIRNKFVPDDALVSVAIIGLDSLFADQKTTYSMVARYASGASAAITPNNFTSADNTLLALNGLQATGGTTRTDQVVKLTGTYITNGQTYTATKDVTIKAQVMTKLEILGADTINSQAEASYTFRVTWSNGKTELVQVDSFSALPAQYTNITGNKVVAKKETVADRNIQLQASYTQNGQQISASKNVVIIHEVVAPFLTKLEIVGASSIKENESANYQFIATMSDQTTRSVNPLTFTVDKAQFATIVNKTVTAGSVDKDEPIVLSASYTLDGITKTATLDVVITNVIVVVTLTKIQIIGANTVPQNTQSDYTVLATYSDGHTATITPDEFKLTAASEYATFENGTLTVGEVNVTSALVTIAAGYTENGVTRNATLTVTLTGTAIVPVAVEVRGADEMNENTQTTLTAWLKMSDNSYVQATSGVTWSIIQGQAYGSITQGGVLSAGEVTQNQSILVRAAVQGLSGDKTVLIKNVIVVVLTTATPRVPAFAYGDALGKTLDLVTDLVFSDATTRLGAASELTYTLNATGQLWFTLVPPTGNTGWQLRAKQALTGFFGDITSVLSVSATVGTTTKVGTANIVLHGPVDEVVRAQIVGADTLTEMMANIYRVSLVMTSGAIIDPRENVGTWSLPVGGAYATLAPAETYNVTVSTKQVTQNQTITLHVENVIYKGQAYTADKQITIIDSGVTVGSYKLVGPNQLAINQTGTYQIEFTMTDGSTQLVDPVVSAKTPVSYMTFNANKATAGTVTTNQTFQLVGTVTFMGAVYAPEMAVTVVAAPQTPLSLLITGPDSVIGGVATSYKATANLSDGTTPDVTDAATWSVAVKSGTVTATIPGGVLTTNKVTADAVVTITVTYTLNGVTATKTKDVTVKPEQTAGEFKPRFGVHAKVTSLAGYDAAFMSSLTTALTESGEQFVTCPANTSTSANNRFFYVAWPKRLGYGYFRDYTGGSYGFAGSWDGAQEFDDFNFVGCAEVNIAGIDYVVWRNDFPFDAVAYVYSIVYGSSDPTSGRP